MNIKAYVDSCRQFCEISDRINDGWKFYENEIDKHKCYIKKNCYIQQDVEGICILLRAEYVIFYNLSYGVPSFSFNVWNSSGVLLNLEDIRQMSFIKYVSKEDFYSIITQQEHPVLYRPYFVMHPCHTAALLEDFKNVSKNIIVTFLGLITPLVKLNLPLEYGL